MKKSNSIKQVTVATLKNGSFEYTAHYNNGGSEVVRTSKNKYDNAFQHSEKVNTDKTGMAQWITFGKKSSFPKLVTATFKVAAGNPSKPAKTPKAKTPKGKTPAAKPTRAPKGDSYKAMAANRSTASAVESPVVAMWDLCNSMVGKRRKEVIDAAVKMGIAFYTARTQYQLWLTAYRAS